MRMILNMCDKLSQPLRESRFMRETLQQYLLDNIPLSRAMQVEVLDAGGTGVSVWAPLPANINHGGTMFGGSLSAVALLCAWGWAHVRLLGSGLSGHIVVQRSEMDYLLPAASAVRASTEAVDEEDWDKLLRAVRRGRKGRIALSVRLEDEQGACCARMSGVFVVLPPA
ncbi:YiiD C-terminal domain-containing protein [uncultured Aquitalea sp.]|uniref:YiiD C-terminal domain-containing protein n=1 Tax=uncultured Aquitalea sp. TaxID=540272 RepID=UPI0025DEA513|nr:YiiD C-terminal domain-containing protein [uncultured Aquitalea sp.]